MEASKNGSELSLPEFPEKTTQLRKQQTVSYATADNRRNDQRTPARSHILTHDR